MKYTLLFFLTTIFYLQTPVSEVDPTSLQAGDLLIDSFGIEQVWVPAGCFLMGTSAEQAEVVKQSDAPAWVKGELPSEQPQHEVCLSEGYRIDRHEVTNAAFQVFVD